MSKNVTVNYKSWNPFNLAATILAIMVSWFYNHSFWWALFHGIFGWIYLIYSLIIGRFADGNFMTIIHHYI